MNLTKNAKIVSIPFKREGTFRHSHSSSWCCWCASVSIPFKREGTFRLRRYTADPRAKGSGFNSLQTGRHIQTAIMSATMDEEVRFQFPSNGKAHSDFIWIPVQ